MLVVNHLEELTQFWEDEKVPPFVLTIGNFDGVHRGHQFLLSKAKHEALFYEKEGGLLGVMTFNPHPMRVLSPEKGPFLLQTLAEKRKTLSELGVDFLVEIPFSFEFSQTPYVDFFKNYLINLKNHPKTLYLGHDFAFGKARQGSVLSIEKDFQDLPFSIHQSQAFHASLEGPIVSSTLIRQKLIKGQVDELISLLGRPFSVIGTVVQGKKRGATLQFPTINIDYPKEKLSPLKGVYLSKTICDNGVFLSVTNWGGNPTFEQDISPVFETHLLDFDGDLYGQSVEIQLFKRVRDEKKFESVEDLKSQISNDIHSCRSYFAL